MPTFSELASLSLIHPSKHLVIHHPNHLGLNEGPPEVPDRAMLSLILTQKPGKNEQPFYGPLIQDNPGEPVLSQRRDLLEQPLEFYEPDVFPAAQPIMSKHYRKTQWFGHLLFCRHDISTHPMSNQQCQSTQGNNRDQERNH